MKHLFGLILIVLVGASSAHSVDAEESWKGMSIFRYCMGDTVLFAPAVCRAYIQGAVDAYQTTQKNPATSKRICFPDNKLEREKGEQQVPKWINFFKERRNEKPIALISDALEDIFSCSK